MILYDNIIISVRMTTKAKNISLYDLVNFLVNDTIHMNDYMNSLKQHKKMYEKLKSSHELNSTNFSYGDSLNNLLFCLIYANIICIYDSNSHDDLISDELDIYDRKLLLLNGNKITLARNKLINDLNSDKYNTPFSKKKLNTLINNNQYNHEIILFLCALYNVNIIIFHKDLQLFKLYYPEDKLNLNKKNLILQHNKDIYSSQYSLQIMYKINNNEYQYIFDEYFTQSLIDEYKQHFYSIGINDNKTFEIGNDKNIINIFENDENKENNENDGNKLKQYIFNNIYIKDVKTYNKILKMSEIKINF